MNILLKTWVITDSAYFYDFYNGKISAKLLLYIFYLHLSSVFCKRAIITLYFTRYATICIYSLSKITIQSKWKDSPWIKSSSKGVIIALIIAVVGALAAAWYFLWYVPHTPAYTLKIIHQAVQEKNADEVLRHVDVKSIVKNIVDREGNKYIDTSNPFGKAAVAATKNIWPCPHRRCNEKIYWRSR